MNTLIKEIFFKNPDFCIIIYSTKKISSTRFLGTPTF